MRTLLRKIGVGVLTVVVGLVLIGAFGVVTDQAWAQKGKSGENPTAWANPQLTQVRAISSYSQAMSQRPQSSQGQGYIRHRDDGEAPGKGTGNPRGCASPPCRHLGHGRSHGGNFDD